MAVAERRRRHAGGHRRHSGQGGFGLQQQALHPKGDIPRRAHGVGDVQTQAAVQRPAVRKAELRRVVDHRARKARILQGIQPGGGFLLTLAEHYPRQLQQGLFPPCRRDALRLRKGENQIFQLVHGVRRALRRIGKPCGQRGQLPHRVGGVGRHREGLHHMGRGRAALFQQLVQRLAAHLIPRRAGQEAKAALPRLGGQARHQEGCAAGLAQRTLNAGHRVLLGGLRLVRAIDANLMAVRIGSRQLDAAVLHAAADRVPHRHTLQLTAEQLAGLRGGGAGSRGVRLGAHAEHFAVIVVRQVAVRKAGAREDVPHQLFIVGLALADGTAGRDRRRRILRRAQTALNLDAGHARIHQLPQMRDVVHILQAQVAGPAGLAGFQPRRGIKRQAAGARAGAAVAAAPAQKGAHHALAGYTHTEGAVDKDFYLNRTCLTDGADFLQRELTRQNHAVIAQRRQFLRALRRVDAHLGRAVQLQGRRNRLDQLRRCQIVRNHGVRPGLGHSAHRVRQAGKLLIIDQRVQRHVHPHPAGMAEGHGLAQLLRGKVARGAAGVEAGQPQINSISAAENSGAKHFAVTRRGQNLGPAHSSSTGNWLRRKRRSSSSTRRFRLAFSRRASSAAILALAASSR